MLSALMLSVLMLSVLMLSVLMLSVLILSVLILSVLMLSVLMLGVLMLNVVAPEILFKSSLFHRFIPLARRPQVQPPLLPIKVCQLDDGHHEHAGVNEEHQADREEEPNALCKLV